MVSLLDSSQVGGSHFNKSSPIAILKKLHFSSTWRLLFRQKWYWRQYLCSLMMICYYYWSSTILSHIVFHLLDSLKLCYLNHRCFICLNSSSKAFFLYFTSQRWVVLPLHAYIFTLKQAACSQWKILLPFLWEPGLMKI